MIKKVVLNIVCGIALIWGHAQAGIIYDNGAAIGDSGRCAETSGVCAGSWVVFDDFVLSTDSAIDTISWTTFLYSGLSDYNFANIWIYDADPVFDNGNLLFSSSDAGTLTSSSLGTNAFDLALSGLSVNLSAGNYWLGFQHDTDSGYATVARSGSADNATQWSDGGSSSKHKSLPEFAFTIEGTELDAAQVPEPGNLAFIAAGLLAMALTRKRAR